MGLGQSAGDTDPDNILTNGPIARAGKSLGRLHPDGEHPYERGEHLVKSAAEGDGLGRPPRGWDDGWPRHNTHPQPGTPPCENTIFDLAVSCRMNKGLFLGVAQVIEVESVGGKVERCAQVVECRDGS